MYLTTTEYSKFTKSPLRTTKYLCKTGKLNSKFDNSARKYLIPLSELSPKLQRKYLKEKGLAPASALTDEKSLLKKHKNLDDFSELEQQQIAFWIDILNRWEQFCIGYRSRVEATEAFVIKIREENPDLQISKDILYRKRKAHRDNDLEGLVDNRGKHNKGKTTIPEAAWQCFLYHYLDQNQLSVSYCLELAETWIKSEAPELLPLPSYGAFYRHLKNEVPVPVEVFARQGEKAYTDLYAPYIRRKYESMSSNEWWIADCHTFDVKVEGDNGTPHRLYLVAFFDARSGIFTGCYVTDKPSSNATLTALRKGILKYGIPVNIYVDNGREFLNFDVGGLGHRQKKSTKDNFSPPPIFERLGIKMTNAIVRNARAKIIERRFRDVKDRLSRLFPSYTGGNTLERPERHGQILKFEKLPNDAEFTAIVEDILAYYFNEQPYSGSISADKGKSRNEVFREYLIEQRVATAEDLNLMLMRSSRKQKIGRRGVHLDIFGIRLEYFNDELLLNVGKEVYYRYDPEDLSTVRIYSLENKYIMTVPVDVTAILDYGAGSEQVSAAMSLIKSSQKVVKTLFKEYKKIPFASKTALDLALEQVEQNKLLSDNTFEGKVVSIVKADEQPLEKLPLAVGQNGDDNIVDIDRMIKNIIKREALSDDL